MLKFTGLFLTLVALFMILSACKDVEDKDLESISLSPSSKQTCNHYDTTADSSYVSGNSCDNDNLNYIQYTLIGNYSNDEEEDLTNSSHVTWTVDDQNGKSASILSANVNGRAYLSTQGTFTIDAKYNESASSNNEDDISETASVVLVVK
jgi:hypothetical protein